ncbi:MAG: ribonuclease PH, partial [Chloroflexota bacterium]|nr:ribonuclease PH [Chloroflexota bacterium]
MPRLDGRRPDELRPIRIVPHWLDFPEGSTLIEMGATRVLCAATIQEAVPDFLKGAGRGWVTAEYSLLPRSTRERSEREALMGRPRGRTQEIARLLGRALRGAVALELLGE